jgi:hypothetical protein
MPTTVGCADPPGKGDEGMTQGDSTAVAALGGRAEREVAPLRAARLQAGWTQASAMRRFHHAASKLGAVPPSGASLKRMFAYWEAGERDVGVPAYREAFCVIYSAPPEALGFSDDAAPELEPAAGPSLELVHVDWQLVRLLKSQTQNLRLLDRRLGSVEHAAIVEAHAAEVERVLHRCVGPLRSAVAEALAEAATLAGWLALDRVDIPKAWHFHELARGAADESGSRTLRSHVRAQQSLVLFDAGQTIIAGQEAREAARIAGTRAPALLRSWLAANEAEVISAAGDRTAANRRLDDAERLLSQDHTDDLPFIMLTEVHLERWRGHCLVLQGDPAAERVLRSATTASGDSVRAAASLHTNLALALRARGEPEQCAQEARHATDLARRCGSARQLRRLAALGTVVQGEQEQQADQGS